MESEPEKVGPAIALHETGSELPVETPSSTNPVAEAGVVAGHGAESTLQFEPRRVSLAQGLASLRYRDFRLYWGGQLVSLIGTWMQIVAQSWLVLELSNSPFILGVLSALQFLPILLLSILGGVVADRLPKRQLLLGTQAVSMFLAFVLAVLTQTGVVRIIHVLILAVLTGVVNAFDMPTRQAFVAELVEPGDLQNAIALNSAAFNGARLVGPAVAGIAIGVIGLAGAFYINGLSFLAALGGLGAMQAGRRPLCRGQEVGSVGEDLREGLAYVGHVRLVWLIVFLVAVVGTFGMNLAVLVPVLARDALGLNATGFGFLAAASGFGSLVAAILLALLRRTPGFWALLVAAALLGLLEVALAPVRQFFLAAVFLGAIGFVMVFFTTLANIILQMTTPDALRGRVMSVYATVFAGTTPLGSLFAGGLAQAEGVGFPFALGGLISVGAALVGLALGPHSRQAV